MSRIHRQWLGDLAEKERHGRTNPDPAAGHGAKVRRPVQPNPRSPAGSASPTPAPGTVAPAKGPGIRALAEATAYAAAVIAVAVMAALYVLDIASSVVLR